MKRIIIMFGVFCLFLGGSAIAQVGHQDTRKEMFFGLKAGINGSNVWDEAGNTFRANAKAGFAGGGFMSAPINKYIGIQPELLFSQKGYRGSGMMGDAPYSYSRTSNFIDVPVLLQIKPAEVVTFVVGPQYSFLLSERDRFTSPSVNEVRKVDIRNNNIRRNILAASAGADLNVDPVVVSGRVGWDLQHNNGDGTSTNPRYKNQWVQLTLGFRL